MVQTIKMLHLEGHTRTDRWTYSNTIIHKDHTSRGISHLSLTMKWREYYPSIFSWTNQIKELHGVAYLERVAIKDFIELSALDIPHIRVTLQKSPPSLSSNHTLWPLFPLSIHLPWISAVSALQLRINISTSSIYLSDNLHRKGQKQVITGPSTAEGIQLLEMPLRSPI
jgi:hypothetical protein